MNDPEVVFEDHHTRMAGFRQVWHCDPPERGVLYRVTKDRWDKLEDSLPIRRIFDWEYAYDAETREA